VICPKCGEVNSSNFRYCGLCGASLEPKPETRPDARPEVRPDARPTADPNRPAAIYPNQPRPNQPYPVQPVPTQPSMDTLRDKSFSGLDSFFEPERYQPKSNVPRILLLIVLLAALGGAGWWTYSNYFSPAKSHKLAPAIASATATPAEPAPAKPAAKDAVPTPDADSPQAASVPEDQPEPASAAPSPAPKTLDAPAKPTVKPAIPEKPAPAKSSPTILPPPNSKIPRIALGDKSAQAHEHKPAPAKPAKSPAKLPAPVASPKPDLSDTDLRKGEAYLYGLGVKADCDQAMKYLKAASAKSNPKARSTFGTMYATGHCVSRDLPTAYSWFALALHADPNNQVLEKDLNEVWSQMTPSERQVAIKTKP